MGIQNESTLFICMPFIFNYSTLKASTQRKIWRWLHIILSVPIIGFVYGPVATIPQAAFAVRWIFFPVVVISGLWMWKGHAVKKWFRNKEK